MKIFSIDKLARTFMPEIIAPGTGLSPATKRSVVPTNNVTTIQDALDGRQYKLPGGGGDWSSGHGEDVSKSFKDDGADYKRQDRDLDILRKLMTPQQPKEEVWEVRVDGGTKTFMSFELANEYKKKLKDKGVNMKYLRRTKMSQKESPNKVDLVAKTLEKTFMVETLNLREGIRMNGAAFCIAPSLFITCAHVIKKYNKNVEKEIDFSKLSDIIKVSLMREGRKFPVEVVNINASWDIALLRADVDVEPFALATDLSVGEEILTIGSPHGFENNASFGFVGSLDRTIYTYQGAPEYIFIDAPVFTGNSGGPIIRQSDGAVIGMLTAIVAASGEYGLNAGLSPKYIEQFCIMNKVEVKTRKENSNESLYGRKVSPEMQH